MKKTGTLSSKYLDGELKDFDGIIPVDYQMLNDLLPGIDNIEHTEIIAPYKMRVGHTTRDEIAFLSYLTKWFEPSTIFEFGTFDGLTTVNMAKNSPENTVIYTLDIPEENLENAVYNIDLVNLEMVKNSERLKYIKKSKYANKVKILLGDSGSFDYSPYKDSIELAFIDASHTFNYCYSDTINALDMIKTGGIIVWHDYNKVKYLPGVTEALNTIRREERLDMYWFNDKKIDGGDTSIVFSIVKK